MHVTLHLTNACNMQCDYCYVNHEHIKTMTPDTAKKAVDLALRTSGGQPTGIIFFGGEPLLHQDLIREIVAYSREAAQKAGVPLHFKMTTNGTLIDDAFLDFAKEAGIFIALSHDGIKEAHDAHRKDAAGQGTFGRLLPVIEKLLQAEPCAPVMMTVNPDTVQYYARSVDFLFQRGFRYLICSLNYAGNWDEDSFAKLKRQYKLLAKWYEQHTLKEDKFFLSPFEVKIASHIEGEAWRHERCELGQKQVSVDAQGLIYPCVQFAGDESYAIGSVDAGIDRQRQMQLFDISRSEQPECLACAIRKRCLNTCGCLNKQVTGRLDRVAPSLCQNERILLPIADQLAARLYRKRNALFIHKHYNDLYPVISMVEERSKPVL